MNLNDSHLFIKSLKSIDDYNEFKKHKKSTLLSLNEKKILNCFELLRRKKYLEIQILISGITSNRTPLIEVCANYLLAISFNNTAHCDIALDFLKKSLGISIHLPYDFLNFRIARQLVTIAHNLNDSQMILKGVEFLKKFSSDSKLDQIKIKQGELRYFLTIENLKECDNIIHEIEASDAIKIEGYRESLEVSRFSYLIKKEDFQGARQSYERLKKMTKFLPRSNIIFIKTVLEFLVFKKPIYLKEHLIKNDFFLYHQLKILSALEKNDISIASKSWYILKERFPLAYGEPFKYLAGISLFSLTLQQLLKMNHSPVKLEIFSTGKSISKTIIYALEIAQAPIGKEELFKLVFKHYPQDKEELKKIIRAIVELRKKGYPIIYKRGCYLLVPKENAPIR